MVGKELRIMLNSGIAGDLCVCGRGLPVRALVGVSTLNRCVQVIVYCLARSLAVKKCFNCCFVLCSADSLDYSGDSSKDMPRHLASSSGSCAICIMGSGLGVICRLYLSRIPISLFRRGPQDELGACHCRSNSSTKARTTQAELYNRGFERIGQRPRPERLSPL